MGFRTGDLVGLVSGLDLRHNIAVPMFFFAMDSLQISVSEALTARFFKGPTP
jgi:hypothetical protein